MVLDDGKNRVACRLDCPTKALKIGPMIWREMHEFTDDCVLLSSRELGL